MKTILIKRTILLYILSFTTALSYGQTHSKQEIMEWIASKIEKYGTGHPTSGGYFRYTNISYENGLITITGENEGLYKDEITIDLNKVSEFFNVGKNYFYLKGKSIKKTTRNSLKNDIPEFTDSVSDIANIYLDWTSEEKLGERMEKALNDLIAILKKERHGKNELY